jgi:hypothetical protein
MSQLGHPVQRYWDSIVDGDQDMKNSATRLVAPFARLLFLFLLALGVSTTSLGAVFVSVAIAPPALPVYVQPVCPGPGYIWTPGYWAYGPDGYYWVPGTWVLAPYVGALWTPGYWAWGGSAYLWRAGYWGPRVGFYGGINYGFGYFGVGYAGGYWNRGVFSYNRAVTNVNVNVVHNTYNRTVVENTNVSRASYNGGAGGITRQATSEERLAERDRHRQATSTQVQHERLASTNRGQLASANNGAPGTTATSRAGAFNERGPKGQGGQGGANAGAPNTAGPRHAQQNSAMKGSGPPSGGGPGQQNMRADAQVHGGPPQGQGQNRGEKHGGGHQGGGREEGHGGGEGRGGR